MMVQIYMKRYIPDDNGDGNVIVKYGVMATIDDIIMPLVMILSSSLPTTIVYGA